jgi:uncharacterized repeat protein (TIGR03803 family)
MRLIDRCSYVLIASFFLFAGSRSALAAPVTLLHSFAGGADGSQPNASGPGLVWDGAALYGTTFNGGPNDGGTVFKVNDDGSGYQVLHSFAGGTSDGRSPQAGLVLSGSTLYGTTSAGGAAGVGSGTVFSIGTDGSGFGVLHAASDPNGKGPQGGLVKNGGTLYGTTLLGGAGNNGVVFSMSSAGGGYQVLHSFAGGPADGRNAVTGLTLSGSTLYGTTGAGGDGGGTVFSIGADGSNYQVLHSFAAATSAAVGPAGDLLVVGSTLYGTTRGDDFEGVSGTLFSMNVDGTNFQTLHTFAGGTAGEQPVGSLALFNSVLVGVTKLGGASDLGTVYAIGTDGSNFELLHSFAGGATDGTLPHGGPLLIGDTLYGTTQNGGQHNLGPVYSLVVPEPSSLVLAGMAGSMALVMGSRSRRFAARAR